MCALNVLCAAYTAWEDGDLPALMDMIAEDIVFAVNVPRGSKSYVGKGIGKADFEARLRRLLAAVGGAASTGRCGPSAMGSGTASWSPIATESAGPG